jgi:hypothetical protein
VTAAPAHRATTATFLRRALILLEAESPAAFHRLVDELRRRPARLDVGGERFAVEVDGDGLRVRRRGTLSPAGWVTARRGVVLELIDGRLDLLGAVEAGRLDVRGDVETVLALARALTAFVDGAVRSGGLRLLLDDYRAAAPEGATVAG